MAKYQRLAEPVDEHDHVRGPVDAGTTLVEYGHYQCADCAALQPHLREVLHERSPQIRLVYRHFPLPITELHPYKLIAAEFAEAAAVRRRFWRVHDWLFDHEYDMSWPRLRRAEQLFDLPPEAVELEISEQVYRARVMRDYSSGQRSGVLTTPTLFLNGARIDAGYALPDLLRLLDQAIGDARRRQESDSSAQGDDQSPPSAQPSRWSEREHPVRARGFGLSGTGEDGDQR